MNNAKKRKLSMDEVKQKELEILLAFDQLAKKHGISYTLAGGTLLGAIRHKGFIPWDDDIDVLVPRPDYEKLLKLVRNGSLNKCEYEFRSFELGNYPIPFTKMVNPSIEVHDSATKDSIPSNLWIDLFPLDGVPSDDGEWETKSNRAQFYKNLIKVGNYRFFGAGKGLGNRIAKMGIKPFVSLLKLNDIAERRVIKMAKSKPDYEEAEYVASLAWCTYGVKERFPKAFFKDMVDVEFEGYSFPAIAGWKEYLTNLYGNYMQLPPIEERLSHGVEAWTSQGGVF